MFVVNRIAEVKNRMIRLIALIITMIHGIRINGAVRCERMLLK